MSLASKRQVETRKLCIETGTPLLSACRGTLMPDNPTNSDNAYYGRQALPSVMPDPVPNRGPSTDPNPGERSAAADAQGAPINSLGLIPSRGNRAGGGRQID